MEGSQSLSFCLLVLLASLQGLAWAQDTSSESYLKILPNEVHKNIGENVYLQCTAHVPNRELVTEMRWEGPNGAYIPSDDGKIRTLPSMHQWSLELLVTNLKREDTGVYNCTAMYATNQRLEASVRVESHMDITFQDVQPKQTPIIHTDAKIKCLVNSDPAPQVDWLKDEKAIAPNDPRLITQADGILIKNITEADEGVYRCRAKVAELGQIEFRDIQVEVHVPPVITGMPEDVAGREKESVTFQCIATGKPAPSYSWANNHNEALNGKEGYYVNEVTGELRIMDLKPEHTGTYRCTAKNAADEVTADAYLTVLTKPKIEEFKNITVEDDDQAVMKCILTGDPLPIAVFKKESEPEPFVTGTNEDIRIEVVQTEDDQNRRVGELKIAGVERKDDGLYTCKGVSDGGESEVWGHITVEFAPTFEEQPQDVFFSWEQRPVNMTCLATSIPNATIQWFLRNEPIREADKNFKVMSNQPNGILQVTPLDGSYFDTYTCRATNRLGTTDHDVELKQVEKPGPVSSAQVKKKTATTVSWVIREPLNNGGLPIKGYDVQYKFEDSSWEDSLIRYWQKDSSYIVDELEPMRTYVFRFAAKNDAGVGSWSGEKAETMPKRNTPEEPLIFGVEEGKVKNIPYSTHYELQWKVPLDNGEPIDHFMIRYYKVKNSTGKWDSVDKTPTEEKVPYPDGGTSYKIEGLESNSFYKIELRAHNEIGYSRPAESIIKTLFDRSKDTIPVPGAGGEFSSGSSTLTTAKPHAADATQPIPAAEAEDSSINLGLLIGIIIVGLLVFLVILDLCCFFSINKGVTASIVKKTGPKESEKDKEAMLEEANVNSREDKEAILKEEKEILKDEELEQKVESEEIPEVKTSPSKTSLNKDSPV